MLELRSVWFGPEGPGWLDHDDDQRYEAIADLRADHPMGLPEMEWDDENMLFAEIVLLDGAVPVGTAMLVVDPDAPVIEGFGSQGSPARIVNLALKPDYRSAFLITSLEDALVELGNLDPGYEEVEGHNGRRIPIPDDFQQAAWALRPMYAN